MSLTTEYSARSGKEAPLLRLSPAARGVEPIMPQFFKDRVYRPAGADHYYIALHSPAPDEVDNYREPARAILNELWTDTGDAAADMLRAVVTALNKYVPEYAAVAAIDNPDGVADKMPRVIIALSDGQQIGLGRPRHSHGVIAAPQDDKAGLTWRHWPHAPDYGMTRVENSESAASYRRLDSECAALYDTWKEADTHRPIENILATVLAATAETRSRIYSVVPPSARKGLPPGPLRVENPCLRP